MNLHENKKLFTEAVFAAAEYLDIRPIYIEKDYWITRSLGLLAQNNNADKAIFKGGTSLSKAHIIGNRFSEDIDIAISDADAMSGNQLKMLIKRIAKDMTTGLTEIDIPGVTSKGSKYYKAVYGWAEKPLNSSPLLSDFPTIWKSLKDTYNKELPGIAFSAIPNEHIVAKSFIEISKYIKKI